MSMAAKRLRRFLIFAAIGIAAASPGGWLAWREVYTVHPRDLFLHEKGEQLRGKVERVWGWREYKLPGAEVIVEVEMGTLKRYVVTAGSWKPGDRVGLLYDPRRDVCDAASEVSQRVRNWPWTELMFASAIPALAGLAIVIAGIVSAVRMRAEES